ncbi:MAG: hypothetical protein RSC93_04580 [Erysipelotrichaceae bacterium]
MKFNFNNIGKSFLLILILLLVIYINISIFISGPNQKYNHNIMVVMDKIETSYKGINALNRHAFAYVTYVGKYKQQIMWFDENGDPIMKRKDSTYDEEKALSIAINDYKFSKPKLTLGYGKKNGVYVIKEDNRELYLDYDKLTKVFYREGL